MADGVDAAVDAAGPADASLISERVGESLHGMAGDDRVTAEVKSPVDLDELHRPPVLGENGERRVPDVPALGREGVRCDRRDGRRAVHAREAKAVHDVLRLDPRPHHDSHRRERMPHIGHLRRELALCAVDLLGTLEKHIALLVETGAFLRAERWTAIADRKTARGQLLPLSCGLCEIRGSRSEDPSDEV